MDLFRLLKLYIENLSQNDCKFHLAVWNGNENPLDEYLAGRFEEWQTHQTKKNFERKYIISLIELKQKSKWLFAGVYTSFGCEYNDEFENYVYRTHKIDLFDFLEGRLIIHFNRTGRQSYLKAENWVSQFIVSELKEVKISVPDFTGYKNTCIMKNTLDLIVNQNILSWQIALSNICGIYLITDKKSGKLYVGSASGELGIWQRWSQYVSNGHGENIELKKLIIENGIDYSSNFQFTILEIMDKNIRDNEIIQREIFWKVALGSRLHGYNAN